MSTIISVVGTVATEPREITIGGTTLCSFRLACSERRLNRETQKWEDGPTNWFTVNAFRALATHAAQSLSKGDRVIVHGKLRIKSWQREEKSGTSVEIDAEALGPELRWGTTTFTKTVVGTSDRDSSQREGRGWATPHSSHSEPVDQSSTHSLDGHMETSGTREQETENVPAPF